MSFEAFWSQLQTFTTCKQYWVAYSGGLDSSVLLHLCALLKRAHPSLGITAVHVHHGLQAAADEWAQHCVDTCSTLNIPLQIRTVDARYTPGQSPEEAARKARYAAFAGLVGKQEQLLTAQHLDDQCETILLQLFRGAGLAGLSGMPAQMDLGHGSLIRPLLPFTRQAIDDYARSQALDWIEDSSNQDTRYDRNFLRQVILPNLQQRWPSLNATVARSGRHCAEAHQALQQNADEWLRSVRPDNDHNTVSVAALKRCTITQQRLLLREWLRQSGYRSPPARVIQRVLTEGLTAGIDKVPRIRWTEGEIRRYRDALYILPLAPEPDLQVTYVWDGIRTLILPQNGAVTARAGAGRGIAAEHWQCCAIHVTYRQGGESARLKYRNGKHTLKKLFQEYGIPPWQRSRTPLIYLNQQLAAVVGLWVFEPFQGTGAGHDIILNWTPPV